MAEFNQSAMSDQLICMAGDGWGAVAAYKSLTAYFSRIDVVTDDDELKSMIRPTDQILTDVNSTKSDFIICAGYRPIVTKAQLATHTFINIHYSLLPKYRGQHSTVWAILNNEAELGLSVHLMTEFIDDGAILAQYAVRNSPDKTSAFYMQTFNTWVENNLGKTVAGYLRKEIVPEEQDKSKATWVGRRYKKDCKIDFSRSHAYLKNMFRALVAPYPLPYIEILKTKEEFSVAEASFLDRPVESHVGRILNVDAEGVYVSSKDGFVILKKLLDQNNCIIDNYRLKIGTFLNQDFK